MYKELFIFLKLMLRKTFSYYLFSTNTGLKVRVETIGVVLYGAFG